MTQRSDNNVFFHACFSISTILIFFMTHFKAVFLGAEMGGVLLEATGESGKLHSHNNPEWETSLPREDLRVISHRRIMQPRLIR